MLVSIVIPAFRAERTLADAVRSLLWQTMTDWECIVVSDDGVDYEGLLAQAGIADARLHFASTGVVGAGCHVARNRGLRQCRGDVIAALDADDVWLPNRLAVLVPQAMERGAAVDGPRVVRADGGIWLYSVFDTFASPFTLDVAGLLDATCPIFPLTRRDLAVPRVSGIEHLEDIISNLRLISMNGPIWTTPEPLMEYRVGTGSPCHGDVAAERFDLAYADIMSRLLKDGLGIAPGLRVRAIAGLARKRALNRRFAQAQRHDGSLDFQSFAAAQRTARVSASQ